MGDTDPRQVIGCKGSEAEATGWLRVVGAQWDVPGHSVKP